MKAIFHLSMLFVKNLHSQYDVRFMLHSTSFFFLCIPCLGNNSSTEAKAVSEDGKEKLTPGTDEREEVARDSASDYDNDGDDDLEVNQIYLSENRQDKLMISPTLI